MRVCADCGVDIFVPGKRCAAKYCRPCANERRAAALREHRAPPRPRRGRTRFNKVCRQCGAAFVVTSQTRRQTYCSNACGCKAIQSARKIILKREDIEAAISQTASMIDLGERLAVSQWTLRRRMHEFGIPLPTRIYKKRTDGYWNYGISKNHRRVMEAFIGRALLAREGVHHIDGDKANNDPATNLAVTTGPREHAAMHHSLQECAFALFKLGGIIGFDRETKRYTLLRNAV